MNIKQIAYLEKTYEVGLYPKRDIALQKGQGVYLFDSDNKKYLDCMTNIGVNILGYGNKKIAKAIGEQISILPNNHQSFYSEERAQLLKELSTILPQTLSKIIFTNSGAESVEAALKLAKVATGRKKFIATIQSYHGKTVGALSLTGQEKYRAPFLPLLPHIMHVPFNNIEAVEYVIDNETAAVIIEPIQGEGGIIIPDHAYITKLKQLCEKHGVLLIADEVQSAIRTGTWLACEQFGVVPDIACFSKSFSYGIPFGFVATKTGIADAMQKGLHGSTFAGNPVACTAAFEVITYIKKKKLLQNATDVGSYFVGELKKLKHPSIKDARGKGLMIAIEVYGSTTPFIKSLQYHGVIAVPAGSNTIRFLPPILFKKKHVDKVIEIIQTCLAGRQEGGV